MSDRTMIYHLKKDYVITKDLFEQSYEMSQIFNEVPNDPSKIVCSALQDALSDLNILLAVCSESSNARDQIISKMDGMFSLAAKRGEAYWRAYKGCFSETLTYLSNTDSRLCVVRGCQSPKYTKALCFNHYKANLTGRL